MGLHDLRSVRALFNHCVTAISCKTSMASTSRSKRRRAGSRCAPSSLSAAMAETAARAWLDWFAPCRFDLRRALARFIDGRMDNHGVDNITFFCDPRRPTVRLPGGRIARPLGSSCSWPGRSPDELVSDDSVRRLLAAVR